MANIRLSKALCAVIGEALVGSHATLNSVFLSAGAPGPPPDGSHAHKWKDWLFRIGTDLDVDSLSVLGNILEELMDIAPVQATELESWHKRRSRVVQALETEGLRYYRGGRVIPTGLAPDRSGSPRTDSNIQTPSRPSDIQGLLETLIKGLRRAMYPLTNRRKGAQSLQFSTEYDVQDLLHALLRPWVGDIRPEEFTPSYAGSSTRMDFLLPKYKIVIELKFVRDRQHGKKIGDEIIIDIEHYRRHPDCGELWCAVFDPNHLLVNAEGLKTDLEGEKSSKDGGISVRLFLI
jgi:REase_DpnII-MboI